MASDTPVIDLLPPAPTPADSQSVFTSKAATFVTAVVTRVPQLNAAFTWVAQQVSIIDGYRQAALGSAQSAAGSASDALTQRNAAEVAKTAAVLAKESAQVIASAYGQTLGLPPLASSAGKFLGVNPQGGGVGWYDPGLKVGDILTTTRTPDGTYLPANGAVYAQSAYASLFSAVGIIGGDVGITWNQLTATYATGITKIVRGNNGTLIASLAASSNTIIRSTDNGATWSIVNPAIGSNTVMDVDTDGNGKWILTLSTTAGASTLRVSTDDGVTWAEGPAVTWLTKVCRYLGNSIWVGGGNTSVMSRSTDNGVTFATVSGLPVVNSTSIIVTDRAGTAIIYTTGTGGGFFRSNNAFASAPTQITGGFSSTAALAFDTDGNGVWVGVGASGAIQRSLDNGLTWALITSGTTVALASVKANGKGTWLVGGATGLLRRTKDNLNTWESYSVGSANNQAIVMTDNVALIGNSGGVISRSLPFYAYDTASQFKVPDAPAPIGLRNWIKAGNRLSQSANVFVDGSPVPGAVGALVQKVAADNGTIITYGTSQPEIYRSSDYGTTWTKVATLPSGSIGGLDTNGMGTWLAYNPNRLSIFRSVDDGLTWTEIALPVTVVSNVSRLIFSSANVAILIVGGASGGIIRTADGGLTWTRILSATNITLPLAAATNKNGLVFLQAYATLFRSTDHGATFTSSATPADFDLTNVGMTAVEGTSVVMALGSNNNIVRSLNGGVLWYAIPTGGTNTMRGITARSSGEVLVVGSNGAARRSVDSGANWLPLATPPNTAQIAYQAVGGDVLPWLVFNNSATPSKSTSTTLV